jgi:polyhydroxybutyrate depolymerase
MAAALLAACDADAVQPPADDGAFQAAGDAATSPSATTTDASAPSDAMTGPVGPSQVPGDASATRGDAQAPLTDAGFTASSHDGGGKDAGVPDASTPPWAGPSGPSQGCGSQAPDADSETDWIEHDIAIDGVAARFLKGGAQYGNQQGYDFSHRNYFVHLPQRYDSNKPYPLLISAGGCGATNGVSGDNGGSNPLADNQDVAVQVGLSYVYPQGGGACFADGSADTPDLPYFDAVLAELDRHYCFDRSQVFVSGFSSGAWETYMLACARGGVIRGIGTQAGGLRKDRPACTKLPVAAFLTAGVNDSNPIKNVDSTGFDSGSGAARDVLLKTNGCTSNASEAYVTKDAPADWNCLRYTSCPSAFPVVWCAISAGGGGHGAGSNKAYWPFWSALKAP